MSTALFGACTKFENREIYVDKPQSIIDQEARDEYDVLKSYVNKGNQANFKLGAEVSLGDLGSNSLLYRLLSEHFDELTLTAGTFNHNNIVQADGSVVLENLETVFTANSTTPLHGGHLVWHQNQQSTYLNRLIADIVLPGVSGVDNVVDFEGDALGTTYRTTTSDATATVVNDPVAAGNSGKVLHILKNPSTAFPQFRITLPDGRKLKYYKNVTIDFKGDGCCGFYGAGMRMAITADYGNPSLIGYGGPSSFGIPINAWGRGMITMPIAALNLTEAQKEWNSFVLTLGSQTGAPDYLIDNVKMNYEIPGETIVKSAEEKRHILTAELDKYIKAVSEVAKNKVKSWSVVYQPIDNDNPTQLRKHPGGTLPANTFYWQDYLGKDYAAVAINMIKQYANNDDKIFITETNLDEFPDKINGLKDLITYTEQRGARVDGIATEFALNLDADKSKIETALERLASTGKLIKISALDIGIGGPITIATPSLYLQQSSMYNWFIKAYNNKIPAAQRAGITFRSPVDQLETSSWRPNEPVGIFTNKSGYQRKDAYVGIVEAFQGK
ncbi:endo-1,4-beta-xylanase [Sphingobacterium sp. SGL-16]|uniref:Endo-1,4-beta-xylanase n=2 Tax=Sphingobacterium litopenaei TaxID=2763500 RepID=A0ABR7Y9V3_9SPHI|nr:endo-1,4-beta-xylanase [Sphingobacterium sp. SGL-16]MBD1428081.1 endo-1,4-beta-xylanase [Sphingobacterium litopenaei]